MVSHLGLKMTVLSNLWGQRDSTFGKIVEKPKEISSDGTLTDSQDTHDTFESNCFMKCQLPLLSCFSCVQLFAIPWTVAHQAPLSMGFSWQEYWSGLPFTPPGDLPDPGVRGSTLIETCHPGQAPEVLVRNTELISLHQPEEFGKRSKGDTTCLTTSQNPSLWHPSWLNKACTTRKDSDLE